MDVFQVFFGLWEYLRMKISHMGLGLGYRVGVAAIPIKILSKFPLQHVKNALRHCHNERGFHD